MRPETGLLSKSDVFVVEPDKLDVKRHYHSYLFIMHQRRFVGEKVIKQMKSKHVLVRTF